MPRKKADDGDNGDTTTAVVASFYDTLKGAGCYKVDSVRRKNGGYELTTWITPARRLIMVKATDSGAISYFEEISEDQFTEAVKAS